MNTLRISLFGCVRIDQSGWASPIKITRTIQALLAYLLLQRQRSQPREVLVDIFWGEQPPERAYSCLNTTLWRLRQALEPSGVARGTYLLTTSTGEVSFNWESDHWLDIAAFEDQARRLLAKPVQLMEAGDTQTLSEALQLCTGELLEGFYDDWAIREREHLRRLQLNSLAHLMQYHKLHQQLEQSIACGQGILDLEPLSEEFHRDLMRLYVESGQRTMAVRQYEICCAFLAKEMGISPMPKTQSLYAQIIADAPTAPLPSSPNTASLTIVQSEAKTSKAASKGKISMLYFTN
jgi:DNA-binding SARP family transcriptional activator